MVFASDAVSREKKRVALSFSSTRKATAAMPFFPFPDIPLLPLA